MNRPVSLALLIFGLCAFPASGVLDSNQNGLSDLWEMQYSGGTLPNPGFDPLDDPDADGWTNAQEAAAGTSPFDANAPDGIVRPQITHIPEVLGVTPEAVIISWPTNLGKQYTLLYSPDLVEWLPVPNETFIGNGSIVEYNFTISQDDKLFWRVQIEDADSDGDGLTNTEEHELGTDPNNSHTVTGYPDMWLATHFLNTLLNGGPSSFDPNDDPDHDGLTNSEEFQHETDPNNPDTDGDYLMDGWEVDHGFDPTNPDENNNGILDGLDDNDGDGLTNEQEQAAGTDPAEEDGEDIGKEAIINGDFSDPVLGSTPSNSSDSTWDYWAGVTGWTADTGSNIEFQNIESTGTNGQYVELKAHPEEHYGICQQVATRVGVTYLLSLDCKIRDNTEENNNIFTLKITGIADQSITPTSTWATQVVSFVATTVLTEIKLVPKNGLDDTMGCLVDNVKLMPVEFKTYPASEAGPDKAHKANLKHLPEYDSHYSDDWKKCVCKVWDSSEKVNLVDYLAGSDDADKRTLFQQNLKWIVNDVSQNSYEMDFGGEPSDNSQQHYFVQVLFDAEDSTTIDRLIINVVPRSTKTNFDNWYSTNSADMGWLEQLPAVYNHLGSGNSDPEPFVWGINLWIAPTNISGSFYHPEATFEMRSEVIDSFDPSYSGCGHQTTYDSNGVLIGSSEGVSAGSADRVASIPAGGPYFGFTHVEADVYPFVWAAQLDGNPVAGTTPYPTSLTHPMLYEGDFLSKYLEVRPTVANDKPELDPNQ